MNALGEYEETGLTPAQIIELKSKIISEEIKESRQTKYRELLEQAVEEIENCYGRETPLTKEIREQL